MIFFFKKKPIVLHCVTERQDVLKLAPIHHTVKFLPDWWKQMPASYNNEHINPWPTMKRCAGFIELYKSGVTMPLWSDVTATVGQIGTTNYQYQFADRLSELGYHPPVQHGNHFDELKFQHLKIMSPWFFVCEDDTKFLFVEPTWTFIKFPTLTILPGVLDFKYQPATHINLFVRRTETQQEIFIPFLEPVLQIVPLSERPLELRVSDDKDILKRSLMFRAQHTFLRKYHSSKKAFDKFQGHK